MRTSLQLTCFEKYQNAVVHNTVALTSRLFKCFNYLTAFNLKVVYGDAIVVCYRSFFSNQNRWIRKLHHKILDFYLNSFVMCASYPVQFK